MIVYVKLLCDKTLTLRRFGQVLNKIKLKGWKSVLSRLFCETFFKLCMVWSMYFVNPKHNILFDIVIIEQLLVFG